MTGVSCHQMGNCRVQANIADRHAQQINDILPWPNGDQSSLATILPVRSCICGQAGPMCAGTVSRQSTGFAGQQPTTRVSRPTSVARQRTNSHSCDASACAQRGTVCLAPVLYNR